MSVPGYVRQRTDLAKDSAYKVTRQEQQLV
jgi:hypothetical protein